MPSKAKKVDRDVVRLPSIPKALVDLFLNGPMTGEAIELQQLADDTGLTLHVCHYPPGTSKWNKIEHRLFCHITQNWRGKPLTTNRETVVEPIASTTTKAGLTVRCELDTRDYPKGIKVSDAEMLTLNIKGDTFHPEWHYTISPRAPT